MGKNKFSIRNRWLEKIEKNNVTIALNVLYAKKEKYILLMFQHNWNCEKQVVLFMISNGEKCKVKFKEGEAKSEGMQWHYLTVKKLPALLGGITSKYHGNFYDLNCLHSFATEKRLEKVC